MVRCIQCHGLDKFKQVHSEDESKMPQLRRDFRRLFLEPGAAIDFTELANTFDARELSLDPLFKRYSIKESMPASEQKESVPEAK